MSQTVSVSTITGTLKNTTNIAVTATYLVSPTSGVCAGTTFTVIVTVNPEATVSAMTALTCSGVTFNTTPTNGTNGIIPAGTLYTWSAPSGAGFIGGQSQAIAVSNIFGTLVNTTNIARTATYMVSPISGNCSGAVFTLTVTINPEAFVSPMSTTTCNGVAFNITPVDVINGVIPTGTLYTWSAPTGTGITGGVSQATGISNIYGLLTNMVPNDILVK